MSKVSNTIRSSIYPNRKKTPQNKGLIYKLERSLPLQSNSDEIDLNSNIFGYSQETILNTISFCEGMLQANDILETTNKLFEIYFGEPEGFCNSKKILIKFLAYKTINPPVKESNDPYAPWSRPLIDFEAYDFYLGGLFYYIRTLFQTQRMKELLGRTNWETRILVDLILKNINEYVYVNSEILGVDAKAAKEDNERKNIIPGSRDYSGFLKKYPQQYRYEPDKLAPTILESCYAYVKNGVNIHLLQCGDCLKFLGREGNNVNVELIEVKTSLLTLSGLFEKFLNKKDTRVESKSKKDTRIESVGNFKIKKIMGAYLQTIDEIKKDKTTSLTLVFEEVSRTSEIMNSNKSFTQIRDRNEKFVFDNVYDDLDYLISR